MNKVKIIGSGRVVENLLITHRNFLKDFDVEVYSRKPRVIADNFKAKNIDSFKPTDDIIILCSSVCEKTLLKKGLSKSRDKVFKSNINHIDNYLERGYFERGRVFVLTNPSELIAEYIFKKTTNKDIFALGQEVDIKRYRQLLKVDRRIKCLGQHFQYPIIQKFSDNLDQVEFRKKLINQVKAEFVNDSPPYESGTYNIVELLKSFISSRSAMVSSYCSMNDSFLCGSLKANNGMFKVNKPTTISEKIFIEDQVKASRKMINGYLS